MEKGFHPFPQPRHNSFDLKKGRGLGKENPKYMQTFGEHIQEM